MATPRYKLVDQQVALHYHIVSRCVRQSWMFGFDPVTGKDYSHRKQWIIARLNHLASYFAVEVMAYTIMSNHYHLVLYYDPLASQSWSDEEVVLRWLEVCPPKVDGEVDEQAKPAMRELLLDDPERILQLRRALCSLSDFMKHFNQSIATMANKEDGCKGHFFEERYYSGALLDEDSVLATMAYVDLNPVRANIAARLEEIRDTSVVDRLNAAKNSPEKLTEALTPLVSGLRVKHPQVVLTLGAYFDRLNALVQHPTMQPPPSVDSKTRRWFSHVASIKKRQRAYGGREPLESWLSARAMRSCETPLAN